MQYTKKQQIKTEPFRKMLKRLDAKHSRYIRFRDNLRCRICGREFEMYENKKGFLVIPRECQCMHIIDRQHKHVRFNPNNTFCGCSSCHVKFDGKWTIYGNERDEFRKMAYERMGITQQDLDLLELAKGQKGKPDYTGIELWLDNELAKHPYTRFMEPIK